MATKKKTTTNGKTDDSSDARYGAYDLTLGRFLTGAVSKADAEAAAGKAPAGHHTEIRKV